MEPAPAPLSFVTLLGLRSHDLPHLLRHVEHGFSFSVFEHLRRNTGMSMEELATLLSIPPRTLTRRRQLGRFSPEESDRLLRAARILAKAREVFEGDHDAASHWLATAQTALGGEVPNDLARTELGAREVENVLERAEHGVFA